jgi:hypothetical protein
MRNKRMGKRMKIALIAPLGLAAIALFGFIVMSLWNWLVPPVFGGHTITFWQAFGLLILSRILVGGLGGGHGDDRRGRRRMREQWEQMTPEEREKFCQGLREHSAVWPSREPENTPPKPAGQ